ncbi:MAG: HAD family hydrolase [Acidimicrobiales bacterium]
MTIQAVVFDFDGVILETEEAEYLAWRQLWEEAGVELSLEEWSAGIGTVPGAGGFHPYVELVRRSGRDLDHETVRARVRALITDHLSGRQMQPGVADWLRDATRLGLPVGIASSSSRSWVENHLARLGVAGWWPVMACFEDCGRAKPDPASYRLVCQHLGVSPGEALAVEDSRNGLLAAKAAGLACVAVPTAMTAHMDFSDADLVLSSLDAMALGSVLDHLGRAGAPSPGGR